jgi:hypothetical protein
MAPLAVFLGAILLGSCSSEPPQSTNRSVPSTSPRVSTTGSTTVSLPAPGTVDRSLPTPAGPTGEPPATNLPVVSATAQQWIRDSFVDIGTLGIAIDAVSSFDNKADMMSYGDLVAGCAMPARTLAASSADLLSADQTAAFGEIADLCVSMAPLVTSGDVSALSNYRPRLNVAVTRVQPLFDEFDSLLAVGDANES